MSGSQGIGAFIRALENQPRIDPTARSGIGQVLDRQEARRQLTEQREAQQGQANEKRMGRARDFFLKTIESDPDIDITKAAEAFGFGDLPNSFFAGLEEFRKSAKKRKAKAAKDQEQGSLASLLGKAPPGSASRQQGTAALEAGGASSSLLNALRTDEGVDADIRTQKQDDELAKERRASDRQIQKEARAAARKLREGGKSGKKKDPVAAFKALEAARSASFKAELREAGVLDVGGVLIAPGGGQLSPEQNANLVQKANDRLLNSLPEATDAQVDRTIRRLTKRLGREPNIDEIADDLMTQGLDPR